MNRSLYYLPFFKSAWTLALSVALISLPVLWFAGIWSAIGIAGFTIVMDRVVFPIGVYFLVFRPQIRFGDAYTQALDEVKK